MVGSFFHSVVKTPVLYLLLLTHSSVSQMAAYPRDGAVGL